MAEQLTGTELATTGEGYKITVKDFGSDGKKTELSFPLPNTRDFALWSIEQQVGMLKRGPWAQLGIPDILWGLAYAHNIGADAMKGDIFPTGSGRWGTSNKYKIKMALATGNIAGIDTEIKELDNAIALEKCVQKKDLECTVTIHVKGWERPIVRKARLSRWYKASNPNWQGNPEHMLELNTIAHACEYVPGAAGITEDDEAPPPTQAPIVDPNEFVKSLTKSNGGSNEL